MSDIVPAILPKNFRDLEERLSSLQGARGLIQVDLVDGEYAPNKTWGFNGETLQEFASKGQGLPLWDEFDFQFDVMAQHPQSVCETLIDIGASSLVLHAASSGFAEALESLQAFRGGEFPVSVGAALLPGASAEEFRLFAPLCDFVQVMGIARVGFQGEPPDERALSLIKALREAHSDLLIQVDGSVTLERVEGLVQAGASRLVVGHAIFDSADPLSELHKFKRAAHAI